MLIAHPHIPVTVLCNRKHDSAGNSGNGSKASILEITQFAECGNPDSPSMVAKKGVGHKPVELAVSCSTARFGNCDLPIVPSVQSVISREPNTSIFVSQNGPDKSS